MKEKKNMKTKQKYHIHKRRFNTTQQKKLLCYFLNTQTKCGQYHQLLTIFFTPIQFSVFPCILNCQ